MRNRAPRLAPFAAALTLAAATLLASPLLAAPNDKPVNWNDGIPEPFHTESASNRPQVIDRPDGAQLELPQGFEVEEFAADPQWIRPRFMLRLANDHILMTDSGDSGEATGAVYHLGPDGKTIGKVIGDLFRPFGMVYHDGTLWVAEATSLKTYPFDASTGKTTGPGKEIYSMADFGRGHWTRSLLFNKDHSKLFLSIGSGSNVDAEEPKERAALLRMNPDGSNVEIYAEGLRNVIGLRHHPKSGEIWAAIQERDGLGDNLVSDYLVEVKEGGFYGWPYAYTGPYEDPRREGEAPEKVKNTLYPDVLLGAHVAVLDMIFYTGDQFPAKYKDSLILAFHGSWNRADRTGYKIAFVPFKDGRPTGGPEDLLTGFMLSPDDRRVWGRPVGLLQMPDGSVIFTDDGGNKIWRISYGE